MAGKQNSETARLRADAEAQITRLLTQLSDLEELKEDLDEDEYAETKAETLQQLEEFKASLQKMMNGDMSLQDELAAMKLAIQGAISEAFQTPEVIKMFALKQPTQLRERLHSLTNLCDLALSVGWTGELLQTDYKLGKVAETVYNKQVLEILTALKNLKQA
eukprot:gene24623-29951_t